MKKLLLSLAVVYLSGAAIRAADWYVSPSATASGNGSLTNPWQFQTALNHPAAVLPGDTIWLRGGVYNGKIGGGWDSYLTGTAAAPIVVRNYNKERAILNDQTGNGGDDPLQAYGAYTWYWGLEFQCNAPNSGWADGASALGAGIKFINCIAHDIMGVAFWSPITAPGSEIYGCLAYYSGRQTETQNGGYGIYAQNTSGTKKRIADNIFFDQWGNYALHLYTQTTGQIDDFNVEGNTVINNCLYIGSAGTVASNNQFTENYLYTGPNKISGSVSVNFGGYPFGASYGTANLSVINNYFASGGNPPNDTGIVAFQTPATGLSFSGNTIYGQLVGVDSGAYPNNTFYLGTSPPRPAATKVFVRPNQYERGRANVTVFNWNNQSTVSVDVSNVRLYNLGSQAGTGSLLTSGETYEIRDVQNFFGAPVATGTYSGAALSIPMTSTTVAQPIGKPAPAHTGIEFGSFIILKTSASTPPPSNTAPTISSIPNVTVPANSSTAALAFTVGDEQTAAGSLTVTSASSNTVLVPTANLVLGGSGANRTLTVTPVASQSGSATITLTVSDGSLTASSSFVLTVTAPPPSNTAPTISSISSLTIAANTSSGPLPFSVGDAQTAAGSLAISSASSNPTLVSTANMVLGGSGATRSVTVTPALNQSGSATLTLTVSDGSLTASSSFVLIVTATPPSNTAPTISSIPNTTIAANSSTGPLAFTVADAQTVAGSLAVSSTSSNPTLVPTANLLLGGSGGNRTLTVTPATAQSGSATITLAVSDGSLTANTSFVLTVTSLGATLYYLPVEAESGKMTSPLRATSDALASGGQYVSSLQADSGAVTIALNIPLNGIWTVWCRIKSPTSNSDSFYVSVDGGAEDIYDTAENRWSSIWQWTVVNGRNGGTPLTVNPRLFNLSAGRHSINFRVRDPQTLLDKILVTNDRNYVPSSAASPSAVTNLSEFIASSVSLASVKNARPLRADSIASAEIRGDELVMQWINLPEGTYQVQYSENLQAWRSISNVLSSSEGRVAFSSKNATGTGFYRLVVLESHD